MAINSSVKNKTMVVTISSPPVNAFSSNDLIEMNDLIEKVSFDNQISVIIVENEGKGFSAKLWSIDLTGYNERLVDTKTDASDPSWSSLLSE